MARREPRQSYKQPRARSRLWDEWFLETPNPKRLHTAQAHPKVPAYFLNHCFLKTKQDPTVCEYVDTQVTRFIL